MKNLILGLLFSGSSLLFFIQALSYKFGTLVNIGPGLFPITISIILFFIGLVFLFDYIHGLLYNGSD